MRRTGPGDLAVPFLLIGIATYVLLRFSYGSYPSLHVFVSAPLVVLAVVEFILARRVRAAVRHDPHAKLMAAILIARCVALGKASSLVSSAVAGAAAAMLVRYGPHASTVKQAASDTRVAAVLLGAALLLVGAGLLLERAGVDPNSEHGKQPPLARA